MIKTLRITSIAVAMLAVVLLVLPVVFGVRGDTKIEEFLKSPGAIDKFNSAKGQHPARDESQTSPLVKQAVDFARYLNPPPPPPREAPAAAQAAAQPAPPVSVTPKFKLIGTSFYADRPELSLALIDEPGRGFNWVRQGSTVGHLTIEQIKDGSIIIKDSHGTSEMAVTVNQPWRTMLKNPPPETRPSASPAGEPATSPTTNTGLVPARPAAPPHVGREHPRFGARTPSPPPSASQQPPRQPAPPEGPAVEVSPQEKERLEQINRLIAEMETDSLEITEKETMEKVNKLVELLGQAESTDSPDVND